MSEITLKSESNREILATQTQSVWSIPDQGASEEGEE